MSELKLVGTVVHEMIHAQLWIRKYGKGHFSDPLHEALYGDNANTQQHEYIAQQYVNLIAAFLQQYANTHGISVPMNYSSDNPSMGYVNNPTAYFQAMAWSGLEGTEAFKAKYPMDAQGSCTTPAGQAIQNIIHAELNYIQDQNGATPGGNFPVNCPNGQCSSSKKLNCN